jgi:hypothetical protein
MNGRGDIVFTALVSDADIDPGTPPGDQGLGSAVFLADRKGRIRPVVRPGDAAPGGQVFDWAQNPSVNDRGDVAFGAHVEGEECVSLGAPQRLVLFCGESVYVRRADGTVVSVAHQTDESPVARFRLAFGPAINNAGDVLFIGDLTPPPDTGLATGVFLHQGGRTATIARPGDLMPGGGHVVSTTFTVGNYDLNNRGDVVFGARLDSDTDGDQNPDYGVFVRPAGSHHTVLVARTGTVLPGIGTVLHPQHPGVQGGPQFFGGCAINDRGQVALQATLTDGRVVLLRATPRY